MNKEYLNKFKKLAGVKNILKEDVEESITLYHGTCKENALEIIQNGWSPKGYIGGNMGRGDILYLTSLSEDTLWFAEEKGCNCVLIVKNIPISYLIFDPEDGDPDLYNYKIENAIKRIKSGEQIPVKLALKKTLSATHIELYKH
jgi:hypothetical protein